MSTGWEVGFLWGTENQFRKGGLSQKVHEGQKCVLYLGSSGETLRIVKQGRRDRMAEVFSED